jgi:hypothetical protein
VEFLLKRIVLISVILLLAANYARAASCAVSDKECLENMMVSGFLKEVAEIKPRKKEKGEKVLEFRHVIHGGEMQTHISQEITVKAECDLKCANSLFADWIIKQSGGDIGWRWK